MRSIILGIGKVKTCSAVFVSISLEIDGEPKNTAAKAGKVERTKLQRYARILSLEVGPEIMKLKLVANFAKSLRYLKERYVRSSETTTAMKNIR
jgi:hypothetical protein